jgi:hypothetical protein
MVRFAQLVGEYTLMSLSVFSMPYFLCVVSQLKLWLDTITHVLLEIVVDFLVVRFATAGFNVQ